jgi:CelD/BcsL family acetyltransferase involved in cellulose biosynthesis/GNAT superfamily N-acetyltransferase
MEMPVPLSKAQMIRPEDCKACIFDNLTEIEKSLACGVLNHWAELMEQDSYSTLFQGPQWTMAWYRNYLTFQPLLLALTCGSKLAGIVPLAVEKSTGRLAFCGDGMADYKDVVALPSCRRRLLSEFLSLFREHFKRGVFSFGSTLPESNTSQILASLAGEFGVRLLNRRHDGWRWWAGESGEEPAKKKTIRRRINNYRREGELTARTITNREEWDTLKSEYYTQHSLRQLCVGRAVSFDNSEKKAFYDELFGQPCAHFMVLEFNRKLIAAHFGCLWHGVLYWGAPAFDIREKQHSPMLVLLALGIENRKEWGFPVGVDLTIGDGEMKRRFSTSRVDLPWVELCSRAGDYHRLRSRLFLAGQARQLTNLIHKDSWETNVKPLAIKFKHRFRKAQEKRLFGSLRQIARKSAELIGDRGCGLVFSMGPEDPQESTPKLNPNEHCDFHENEFADLLCWKGDSLEVSELISEKARLIPELQKKGQTFHTVLINGRLAAWGISYFPTEPAVLSESGGAICEFLPESVSLYDFCTLPEFRGRKLYQALLVHILRLRFGQGARHAYIGVAAKNIASRRAIERVGFRLIMVNRFYRFLKWKKLDTKWL